MKASRVDKLQQELSSQREKVEEGSRLQAKLKVTQLRFILCVCVLFVLAAIRIVCRVCACIIMCAFRS